jgi:nucleotide-binding universal stress UspA family protein|tara:strand:+ start:69 stop:506 length:438 start_codon:yes stop_codon:yes gene_type:complete
MPLNINKIMVCLFCSDDEGVVLDQAVFFAEKFDASLVAIHVNRPHAGEMSMMMDNSGSKITKDMIKNMFVKHGYEQWLKKLEIRTPEDDIVSKTIAKHAQDVDMLILGHRKMNTFKASFSDSVDEGIANLVSCPVVTISLPKRVH